MPKLRYGSRRWLNQQYGRVDSDPWGLEWRPSQRERYHRMIEVLTSAAKARPTPPRAVLDVGCATGTFTTMLRDALGGAAADVRGIDASEVAIARARTRHPEIAFDCLSLEGAEAQLGPTFDLITMLEVLYYVPEAARATVVRRLRRLLKPGGMIVVSSMIAQRPYMSLQRLRDLLGSAFRTTDSGVLYLRPLVMLEKPLLWLMPFVERLRGGAQRSGQPKRSRMIGALSRLARETLGARAVSHGYVVAVAEGGP
ncbi:MAG TPA: class I SAM-dependent methyltransferase [Polyangia bacterium]|nr:class I SAM-dependent methyltransferase [Polyangia bacterium]